MILLDPDLDPDPPPRGRMPVLAVANRAPRPKSTSPRTVWRRAPVPWAERLPKPQTLARFLAEAQEVVGLRGQVTVLLTTDATIRDLNLRFRSQNKATDVLSFAATGLGQIQKNGESIAGDLAISVETARRQAVEQGHALTCELKVLILHGVLHLAGYDHETDEGRMEERERQLRVEMGLPEGLIERSSLPTLFRRGGRKDETAASQRVGKAARSRRP